MVFDSFDAVVLTFSFLVPGYIIEEIMRSLMPMKNSDGGTKILRCLGYSIFNYIIWFSWGLRILSRYFKADSVLFWCIIAFAVLITGVITGTVIGVIRATEIFYKIINLLLKPTGVTVIHPIPTAWDYVFKNAKEGARITVRMDNGKFIRGKFYTHSMASSDDGYRDIFLENAYILNDKEEWEPVLNSSGVWLSPEAIKHIEFSKLEYSDISVNEPPSKVSNVKSKKKYTKEKKHGKR